MTSVLRRIIPQDLPVLNVTMLGPSGVGKTTLLAALYDQFDKVSQDLQLVAEEGTRLQLNQRLQELRSIFESDSLKIINEGVTGTRQPRSFEFEFGQTGTAPAFTIKFLDYPGGWLEEADNRRRVQEFIRDSAVVLIPIDTSALMQESVMPESVDYHEFFNKPSQLNELFKTIYKDLDSPRLVILAPVKCETYMNDPADLFRKVRKGYEKMLNQFASEKLLPKVAVVITPVETIGGVELQNMSPLEDNPRRFNYCKKKASSSYEPRNTEVPLRYLLRFLLSLHLNNRRSSILSRILDYFGRNSGLRNAVSRFAEPRPDEAKIVQGIHLLKLLK